MDLRDKLRSGMIAVTKAGKYIVLTDCDTVNYGRQKFCLIDGSGFMTSDAYHRDLCCRSESFSINSLYRATVDSRTYAMECPENRLIWTRNPKNLKELIISRRFSR